MFQNKDMDWDLTAVQEEVEIAAGPSLPPQPNLPEHPLGTSLFTNPNIEPAILKDPSLAKSALRCFLAAKAPGTARTYVSAILQFQAFCLLFHYDYPDFTAAALTHYILHMDNSNSHFGKLAIIKPALVFLEQAMGRQSVFCNDTDILITGAKKRAREAAGPVKKAPPLLPQELTQILMFAFPPDSHHGHRDAIHVRTAFRSVIIYHTLCRLNCFRQLKARHFELVGDDILITFPKSKNDQYHKGQQSCLASNPTPFCPVRICKIYFSRFGLKFGEQGADDSFLLFQLRREKGESVPIKNSLLSPSQATTDLRKLLAAVGVHRPVTDKSTKMTGVTAAFSAGASTEDVMHIGRWRTPSTPLHYKLNSFAFKKKMALKVPPVSVPPT